MHDTPAIVNYPFFRQDGKQMCMNVYDVRKYDTLPACGMNWPEDLAEATKYLDVRSEPNSSVVISELTTL